MSSSKPPLTDLGKRYTHPTGPLHDAIGHTGKSGMTPVTETQLELETDRANGIEAYQRKRFRSLTMREVHGIGAFAPLHESRPSQDGMRPIGVDYSAGFDYFAYAYPFHKVFHRRNWSIDKPVALPRWLLPGGKSGYWEVRLVS
jgi:hypothetical protein